MGEKEKQMIDQIFNFTNGQKKDSDQEGENVSVIVDKWLDPKNVKYKTRYSTGQVTAIAIFQSLAEKYKIQTLKRFLNEYRTAKLSEKGESSKELKEILIARIPNEEKTKLEKLTRFIE